jgi:hypothetical protein
MANVSTQVDPSHNVTALLMATAEFSFCLNATSVATALPLGYQDFGDIVDVTPTTDTQKVEHLGAYRGVRTLDSTVVTQSKLQYKLKCDEWNKKTLQVVFGGDVGTAFTQTIKTAASADTLGFTATPAVIGNWYDILFSGLHVRTLTTVTVATLSEGTDFVVDLKLGRIKFLTAQAADRVPVVTAAAILSTDTASFFSITPLTNVRRQGMGRIVLFDQNSPNVVIDHADFLCEIILDSTDAVGGTAFSNISMTVTVKPPVSSVLIRLANA